MQAKVIREKRGDPEIWQSRAESLSQQAYALIRDKILQGRLPLGTRLSRRKLASEFGMGLFPISSALQRLRDEGLLEGRPRSGTRVKIPTHQDIQDRYILREALESQAARLFSLRAVAHERVELQQLAADLDARQASLVYSNGDPKARWVELYHYNVCHTRFHMRIAECAGCRALYETIEKTHVLLLIALYEITAGVQLEPNPTGHGKLAEILAGRDPEKSDAAMRAHVRTALEDISRKLKTSLYLPRVRSRRVVPPAQSL
jgi:DNA-binding GntR family transcriptional regulator